MDMLEEIKQDIQNMMKNPVLLAKLRERQKEAIDKMLEIMPLFHKWEQENTEDLLMAIGTMITPVMKQSLKDCRGREDVKSIYALGRLVLFGYYLGLNKVGDKGAK